MARTSRPARRVRVLTLMGGASLRARVEPMVRRPQVEVVQVADAAAALAIQDIFRFDLILLEYGLPGVDIERYLEATRASDALCSRTPIFILTTGEGVETFGGDETGALTTAFPRRALNGAFARALSEIIRPARRHSERLLVEVRPCPGSFAGRFTLQSTDVSESGLFVGTSLPLPAARELSLVLSLPEDARPVVAGAEVVRRGNGASGRPGVGLRFLRFDSDGRERLTRFLQSRRGGGPTP